ncbi:Subtilisin-like protein [Mycena sanguinolenta]|uniref:tripeptidyl-peptidase II n=1 Tax=Mycena sanguinolenta TaxID=230812 RepID=A0A8H6ZES0_9AGAR|nr:Subtilisin-like protein [Mycena sanguinolenta]
MLAVYLVAALTLATAKPLTETLVVHERLKVVPDGFVRSGAAHSSNVLNLHINLAQNNLAGLESALMAAAVPSSPSYGQWLSKEEVEPFARPSDETTAAVSQWLSDNGLDFTPVSAAGDWISITVPVSKANELLKADFSVFTHEASRQQSVRTMEYSIPASLQAHIKVVTPTTSFAGPHRSGSMSKAIQQRDATGPVSCIARMTPACLQNLYQLPTAPATNKSNVIGVAGLGNNFADQPDLTRFLKKLRPDMPSNTSFSLTSVDGGTNNFHNPKKSSLEANLDIQYTVGVATGVPITFVSVGDNTPDTGFLHIATALLAEKSPPQVLTSSYSVQDEAALSKRLTFAICNAYMQLAARGVSILFASGDGGVAASQGEHCKTFDPSFPSCPYVTLVGATAGPSHEVAAYLSGGGFSNYFPRQPWQADAVTTYLASLGTKYAGRYNASGRAYPDVSATGESLEIVYQGAVSQVDGTSASAPIFASVIGLLNDELLNAGRPVLGFLNPWIYANPQAFNDITLGSNPGCGTRGFNATRGWDSVTGMGSPNFPAMRAALGLDVEKKS